MGWQELAQSLLTCAVLLGVPTLGSQRVASRSCFRPVVDRDTSIYNFTATDLMETRNVSLSEYQGKQEPGGSGLEIWNGIKYVRPGNEFEPNFPIFKKIDVNGEKEHPLYAFLKKLCPTTREAFEPQHKLFYTPMKSRDIRWNFEKILVDRTGMPVVRYDPSTQPKDIEANINYLLSQSQATEDYISI